MKPQTIGITGSPIKNSNTDRLIQEMLESSGLPSEVVTLSKKNVHPCIACLGCKDDSPELAEKARKAGAIVVGGYMGAGRKPGKRNSQKITKVNMMRS